MPKRARSRRRGAHERGGRLAGFFEAEADARAMTEALQDLFVFNESDCVLLSPEKRRYRVFLTGGPGRAVPAHLPPLPLRRWPTWLELAERALAWVREHDHEGVLDSDIHFNPPLDEGHIREREARSGITLPDDYRLFLSKIGNGGQLGVMRYMTLDEVLAHNTASVWALPLPAELRDIVSDEDTQAQVAGDVFDDWPGLLRVTHASYNRLTDFLTRDGAGYALWMHSDDEPPVCVGNGLRWLQGVWYALARLIEPLERVFTQMKGGASLKAMEASLAYGSNPAYLHRAIGTLLGKGVTVSQEALAAWQARHAKA
jgi:hypothetical protein